MSSETIIQTETSFTERITKGHSKKKFVGKTPRSSYGSSTHLLPICFEMRDALGKAYPSYSNSEKDRYVCRPSRTDGIHDGYDRNKQTVKMADVFGIEKVWASIYESNRQHGDFMSKRSTVH